MRFFGRLTHVVVAPLMPVLSATAAAVVAPAIAPQVEGHCVRRTLKTITAKNQRKKR